MNTIMYTQQDVHQIVRTIGIDQVMDDIIEGVEQACLAFDPNRDLAPERSGFHYTLPHPGLIEWMPAMQSGESVVIKIVGYHPENPAEFGLPTILSTVLCLDPHNGHLLAVMDGTLLTALRTAAASAVASRILAREDSRVLGMIGCGAQAVSHLHALSRVFDLDKVLVYDRDPGICASFDERASLLQLQGIDIEIAPLEQLASAADILCTATSVAIGEGPVFEDRFLQRSLHVNAVGSDFRGKVEIPLSLLQRSLVCPDFREQAIGEGECQRLTEDQIGPDLAELVQGADRYREHRESTTVFDSTGWALEDKVAADVLLRHGQALGCGVELSLANISSDPHNPYAGISGLMQVRGASR